MTDVHLVHLKGNAVKHFCAGTLAANGRGRSREIMERNGAEDSPERHHGFVQAGPACRARFDLNVGTAYVCYNLRRFSRKLRPSYLVASRLTGLAAVCALGAALFLATGSERFFPLVGYFAWLASMAIVSFTCWRLGMTIKCEPDVPSNDATATQDRDSGKVHWCGQRTCDRVCHT